MTNQSSKGAWGQLLADVLAGDLPFYSRTRGHSMGAHLFCRTAGKGYTPDDSVRITGAGHRYIQGLYTSSGRLGSSPAEYQEKFFRNKG